MHDLVSLLKSLRFWEVYKMEDLPLSLFEFLFHRKRTLSDFKQLTEFENSVPCLSHFLNIKEWKQEMNILLAIRARVDLDKILWLHTNGYFSFSTEACSEAAKSRDLSLLTYLHKSNCPWDKEVIISAILAGSMECLQYAIEHGCPSPSKNEAGPQATQYAAKVGRIDMLEYLHQHDKAYDALTLAVAVKYGQMHCVKYLYEHHCPMDQHAMYFAAVGDNIDCMKYLHERECPWCDYITTVAFLRQSWRCLRYAAENRCNILTVCNMCAAVAFTIIMTIFDIIMNWVDGTHTYYSVVIFALPALNFLIDKLCYQHPAEAKVYISDAGIEALRVVGKVIWQFRKWALVLMWIAYMFSHDGELLGGDTAIGRFFPIALIARLVGLLRAYLDKYVIFVVAM